MGTTLCGLCCELFDCNPSLSIQVFLAFLLVLTSLLVPNPLGQLSKFLARANQSCLCSRCLASHLSHLTVLSPECISVHCNSVDRMHLVTWTCSEHCVVHTWFQRTYTLHSQVCQPSIATHWLEMQLPWVGQKKSRKPGNVFGELSKGARLEFELKRTPCFLYHFWEKFLFVYLLYLIVVHRLWLLNKQSRMHFEG